MFCCTTQKSDLGMYHSHHFEFNLLRNQNEKKSDAFTCGKQHTVFTSLHYLGYTWFLVLGTSHFFAIRWFPINFARWYYMFFLCQESRFLHEWCLQIEACVCDEQKTAGRPKPRRRGLAKIICVCHSPQNLQVHPNIEKKNRTVETTSRFCLKSRMPKFWHKNYVPT